MPATTSRPRAQRCLALLLLLGIAACSADGAQSNGSLGVHPWVMGGQTGALMPPCGLTPSAAAGDSIPGGSGGIVLHTDACGVGLAAAELELRDEDGMLVSFEIERLPGGVLLLRPRSPLMAGVYRLTGAGLDAAPVVAAPPPEVPTRLGQLVPETPSCGANFALTLDPLVLEYLPQLKLSVSVDGGPAETWFDYGTLDVTNGRAELSLEECFPSCLYAGSHSVRVTADLAGEPSALEPIEVTIQTDCPRPEPAAADSSACGVAMPSRPPAGGGALPLWVLLAVSSLIAVRRARR